ncbi:hypothetical protein F4781DRAFT_433029 [Annulohypoxylon bovei var. microspora]|nr:hypothetical protein F4781DRAFT_433029 [Annulohypoxylon bovei var. microspora]
MADRREEIVNEERVPDEVFVDAMDVDNPGLLYSDTDMDNPPTAYSLGNSATGNVTAASSTEAPTAFDLPEIFWDDPLPGEDYQNSAELDGTDHRFSNSSAAYSLGHPTTESVTTASSTVSPVVYDSRATKVIKRNKSEFDSLMINAPTSNINDWKSDNVTIKKNTTGKSSTMFNYPISADLMRDIVKTRSDREPRSGGSSFLGGRLAKYGR